MAATFNVGDRVIYDCPEYTTHDGVNMQGHTGVVLNTLPNPHVAWDQPNTRFYTHNGHANVWSVPFARLRPHDQTIKSTSKETPMSARNELIRANRTPDERFLLDEYIVNSDGSTLTSDGTAALLQWLFDTNRDAFVADLRAAYKANANATVADKAAISADVADDAE